MINVIIVVRGCAFSAYMNGQEYRLTLPFTGKLINGPRSGLCGSTFMMQWILSSDIFPCINIICTLTTDDTGGFTTFPGMVAVRSGGTQLTSHTRVSFRGHV